MWMNTADLKHLMIFVTEEIIHENLEKKTDKHFLTSYLSEEEIIMYMVNKQGVTISY